jgi:hypothetical protein
MINVRVHGFDANANGRTPLVRLLQDGLGEILEAADFSLKNFKTKNGTVTFDVDDQKAAQLVMKEMEKTGLNVEVVDRKFDLFVAELRQKQGKQKS